MGVSKRRPSWMLALPAVAFVLAACGSASPSPTDPDSESTSPPSSADGAFPVTIEHKFGATEITEEPQRVLSLGFQQHDTVFALGVEPVAVRYWYGDEDDVIFSWAEEAAGDADPEILNMPVDELNVEKMAALDPDLILGVYAGITENDYSKLAAIAPTVPQRDEYVDYGVPWQEATRIIGTALGRSERAELLDADVLVWDQVGYTEGGRATIEADPLLQQLHVVRDGRTVFFGELEDAFAWNSVLSLPVALEGLVPMLERAANGDPSTEPSPASQP